MCQKYVKKNQTNLYMYIHIKTGFFFTTFSRVCFLYNLHEIKTLKIYYSETCLKPNPTENLSKPNPTENLPKPNPTENLPKPNPTENLPKPDRLYSPIY